jgi:hypothetical protein
MVAGVAMLFYSRQYHEKNSVSLPPLPMTSASSKASAPVSSQLEKALLPVPTANIEDMLTYPEACLLKDDRTGYPLNRIISFDSSASNDEITDFYKRVLLAQGWVSTSPDHNDDPNYALQYQWSDPTKKIPYKLKLMINVRESTGSMLSATLILDRYPDLNKMPIHPGAEQTNVSIVNDEPRPPKKVVSYLVDADDWDILRYLVDAFLQYGWSAWQTERDITTGETFRIRFGYADIGWLYGEGRDRGGDIILTAQPSGKTKVEMQITERGSYLRLTR